MGLDFKQARLMHCRKFMRHEASEGLTLRKEEA